jgi:hypothetical protein
LRRSAAPSPGSAGYSPDKRGSDFYDELRRSAAPSPDKRGRDFYDELRRSAPPSPDKRGRDLVRENKEGLSSVPFP